MFVVLLVLWTVFIMQFWLVQLDCPKKNMSPITISILEITILQQTIILGRILSLGGGQLVRLFSAL